MDAMLLAVFVVDVVGTDARRGNHPDGRAIQQVCIALRAGTDHESVGIPDIVGRDVLAFEIDDVGVAR